jgi:serine/threonine protein phosphatase 1
MPAEHLRFLTRLELVARYGDYLFVHAGLRPGRALDQQEERDILEIREPFLKAKKPFPYLVVHGHSPADQVHHDDVRLGLDTGAYATGRLSAARIQDDHIAVFTT